MNPNTKLATLFIVVVALGTTGTTTAFAQLEESGIVELDEEQQAAIETADEAVHIIEPEEGEEVSDVDVAFHQALCKVGISTEALDELVGGCEGLPSD
jgi:DNA-binding transcriptional regulator YhcF (GntR family)